ncbi:MAG: hypothetical protein IJF83_03330 [Methanobrevibacter sp.]|nr:hypothetical protein [Methanobrevibacter sp.]
MSKRYRLKMGTTHEDVRIADDEKREYLHGYQVDRLNEYDEKCKIMESKLEELGFKLVFLREEYDMHSKKFENKLTTTPGPNDNGEWIIITLDEFNTHIKSANTKLEEGGVIGDGS